MNDEEYIKLLISDYNRILDKMRRYEKALIDIKECNGVVDIYDAVKRAENELLYTENTKIR